MIAAVLASFRGTDSPAVITEAMPFSVVMAVIAYSMIAALRGEEAAPRRTTGGSRAEEPWTGRKECSQKASG